MDNELIVKPENLLAVAGSAGLGELIQPLTREIYLFESWIAGTTHLVDKTPLEKVQAGDKLTLRREDNRYDEKAILVLNAAGQKLGYVPEKDNVIFSRLMDAGKMLTAKVIDVELKGTFYRIRIAIYLVDF